MLDDKTVVQNNKLIDLLRFYKEKEKVDIAQKLDISMPTLYKALDELRKKKIIIETEKNFVEINKEYGTIVGLSIGSSLCKIVFLHFDYTIFTVDEFTEFKELIRNNPLKISLQTNETDDNSFDYICFNTPKNDFEMLKDMLDFIFGVLVSFIKQKKLNVISIGISCTGIINESTKTIVQSHNLDYLTDRTLNNLIFPDKLSFFDASGISLSFMQNSNASVIAEKTFLYLQDSLYKSKKNIVSLYYGVGTGAGFILNNVYFNGTSGFAGEIGHINAPTLPDKEPYNSIELPKELCTCGNENCFDHVMRQNVFKTSFDEFSDWSSEDIYKYLYENPDSGEILGFYFGNMINMITSILNVDLIVFTGKITKSIPLILNSIVKIQDSNPSRFSRKDCNIITSDLGSLSPSVGVAIYSYYEKLNLPCQWNF